MNKPTLEDINKCFAKNGYNIKVSSIDYSPCFISKWRIIYKIYVENQSKDLTYYIINNIWKLNHHCQYNNVITMNIWNNQVFNLRFIK